MEFEPRGHLTDAAVLAGVDTMNPADRAAVEGYPRDPEDPRGLGIEATAGDLVDLLQRSPEHRVIMAAARRAGRPQSWAAERWSDPTDIAWELAYDAWRAAVTDRCCPNCGTDPDDVLHPITRRVLDESRVKLEVRGCEVCAASARRSKEIDPGEREMLGTYITATARQPGDPFVDEGGHEFDRGDGLAARADVDLTKGGFG